MRRTDSSLLRQKPRLPRQNHRHPFRIAEKERNAVKARSIANQIAAEWNDSGSATVNLLMQWAGEAADEKRNAAAYDFLDQVILLDPNYVQAPIAAPWCISLMAIPARRWRTST